MATAQKDDIKFKRLEDFEFSSIEDFGFESGTVEEYLLRVYKELIFRPQKLMIEELETLNKRTREQKEKLDEIIEKIKNIEKAMELKKEEGFLDKFF